MLSIAEVTKFDGIWLYENELKMQKRDTKIRALKCRWKTKSSVVKVICFSE
jgi:hypothetical protein